MPWLRVDESHHHPDDDRGACRTRRPSCRPSRRTRRSGTRTRRRAGRGTRSPRCRSRYLVEVHDQVAQLLVRHRRLADLAVEVDVLEHALERPVAVLQRRQGLVQPVADVACAARRGGTPSGRAAGRRRSRVEGRATRRAARPRPGCGPAPLVGDDRSRSASNWSEARFRNSIPKMYSLNSEASILPRRMSAAANRCRSSCGNVKRGIRWLVLPGKRQPRSRGPGRSSRSQIPQP